MELTTLNELYIEELRDLYNAENQLLKALPKMAKAATDATLKQTFEDHLQQTHGHVERLEQIFEGLGQKPTGKVCKAMQGLVEEGAEMIGENATPEVKDAGLIAAAQRVEHYEMAGYGSVCEFASELGDSKAVKLLKATLSEEENAGSKLTTLASETINRKAIASSK